MRLAVSADIPVSRGFRVLADFSCTADALAILGPSGSGKSTLLSAMLGATRGCRISIDGAELSEVPLHRREIAYVPQDALLFPHLTVAGNIGYSGASTAQIREAAAAMGISELLDRIPRNLSGGERKRVSLARAIARRPRALFLDEPFAGLDEPRKRDVISLLRAVVRRYEVPLVLVTHLSGEAMALTDFAVRLENGRQAAQGPTALLLRHGDVQIDNFLTGEVDATGKLIIDGIAFQAALPPETSGKVRVACAANEVLLSREKPAGISARNVWMTACKNVIWIDDQEAIVELERPGMKAVVTRAAIDELDVAPSRPICAILKATSLVYLGKA